MRITSRAVIIVNNAVLLMYRKVIKNDQVTEYYRVPGGGIEQGEDLKTAVKRELFEEFHIEIEPQNYLGSNTETVHHITTDKYVDCLNHYFECQLISKNHPTLGGEELLRNSEDNLQVPVFVPIKTILENDIKIYGEEFILNAINKDYKQLND